MKNYVSLKEIQADISDRNISCHKLVEGYLANISKKSDINAFIEVYESEALEQAIEIDKKIKNRTAGKLAGLIVGLKDNICYKNHYSSAASKMLKSFRSTYSATVVNRLIEEDAIILGRLNCDEFAMGSSNENSIYGPTKNPINKLYVPGGSSGASAAAVKANLCQLALGTDTGGSIRQPAAFCGVIGLKPTYGLVSRHGLIAFASSFDQIGPLAKSTEDISRVMNVISGTDEYDSTCIGEKMDLKVFDDENQKTFAVFKETLNFKGLHTSIKTKFKQIIKKLEERGHIIKYIDLPLLEHLVPTYYILTTAEASSNLSRYDGIKYGHQTTAKGINELISTSRTEGFGKEVQRRIMLGTYVLSAGYYDAYYTKAQKIRNLIQVKVKSILSENNYILIPTTPNLPFKIGQKNINPTTLYYQDIFTVIANLSGHPAVSFPIGEVENKFFASAQLIGKFFSESDMLSCANKIINN